MPKLPLYKPREISQKLISLGFILKRQKGSHCFYYNPQTKRSTVLPVHNNDIKKGLLAKILKDIGMDPEEFKKLSLLDRLINGYVCVSQLNFIPNVMVSLPEQAGKVEPLLIVLRYSLLATRNILYLKSYNLHPDILYFLL